MTMVWRAAEQPPAARLGYIQDAVAQSIAPFELRAENATAVQWEIRAAELGALSVVEVVSPTSEAVRGPRLIRRFEPELCTLHVQLRGDVVIEQDDRQVRATPDDLVFMDLSRPARVAGTAEHRCVSLMFPRVLLPLPGREIRDLAGARLSARRGPGALLAGMARQLTTSLDAFTDASAARVSTAVLELIAATLAAGTGRDEAASPPRRRALVPRIEAFIEQRLGDPDLNPGSIAAAHHISLRYLHRLFEPHATTVAHLIRTRRLERCRRELTDPVHAAVPVSAIGARWGFHDPARFSRAFRAAYEIPPSEYRRLMTPDRPGRRLAQWARWTGLRSPLRNMI